MADRSAIEWTEATWNPLTGCDKVSEGCDNCYIERTVPFRIQGRRFDESGRMGVRVHPDRLDLPLRWRKPRLVFVNSLSDLYNPAISGEVQAEILGVMRQASQHTFQVLTKRPARMARQVTWWLGVEALGGIDPPPNVWLGTSIELDKYAFRADHLRATPAAVRWLSLEPLLGPLPSLEITGIDWVVVGGESGPRARPMHPDWVRDIRDRCIEASIPFFFKQWGEWSWTYGGVPAHAASVVVDDGSGRFCKMWRVGKKAAGATLDGRTWNEFPEQVAVGVGDG